MVIVRHREQRCHRVSLNLSLVKIELLLKMGLLLFLYMKTISLHLRHFFPISFCYTITVGLK